VSGGSLSGREGGCSENGDRSLPVSLHMWDGWKAVGDIEGRFQDLRLLVACTPLQTDRIIVTDSNMCHCRPACVSLLHSTLLRAILI